MDEWSIIEDAMRILPMDDRELLGFDDAQAIPLGEAFLVVNVDVFDEATDWLPGMSPRDAGWKATVSALSDVLVKGGRPLGVLVALGLPEEAEFHEQLLEGISEACREYSVRVWGGDTGRSATTYLSMTAVGVAEKLCPRGGARPGDVLLCTGEVGVTSVAYKVLLEGFEPLEDMSRVLERAYRPRLPPQAFWLSAVPYVTSSIDDSDGFALSLHHLARASRAKIVVEHVPISGELALACGRWGLDALELALYEGGEEYNFIFTVGPDDLEAVEALAGVHGLKIYRVGRVEEGSGVFLEDGRAVEARGWTHFKAR